MKLKTTIPEDKYQTLLKQQQELITLAKSCDITLTPLLTKCVKDSKKQPKVRSPISSNKVKATYENTLTVTETSSADQVHQLFQQQKVI